MVLAKIVRPDFIDTRLADSPLEREEHALFFTCLNYTRPRPGDLCWVAVLNCIVFFLEYSAELLF